MINASSSIAASFLTTAFGPSSTSVPGLPDSFSTATPDASSPDYLLSGSLAPSDIDLTNIAFAQDTESLLSNPYANGAISGTPSTNVQKLLSELDPPKPSTSTPPTSTTSDPTTTTPTLPNGGLLA